jgi:hypothetical protein
MPARRTTIFTHRGDRADQGDCVSDLPLLPPTDALDSNPPTVIVGVDGPTASRAKVGGL